MNRTVHNRLSKLEASSVPDEDCRRVLIVPKGSRACASHHPEALRRRARNLAAWHGAAARRARLHYFGRPARRVQHPRRPGGLEEKHMN